MEELRSCPFCGGQAEIMGCDYYWIRCKACGIETKGAKRKATAIEYWNRRADREEIEYDYEAED